VPWEKSSQKIWTTYFCKLKTRPKVNNRTKVRRNFAQSGHRLLHFVIDLVKIYPFRPREWVKEGCM
jgi:hypothetical protein